MVLAVVAGLVVLVAGAIGGVLLLGRDPSDTFDATGAGVGQGSVDPSASTTTSISSTTEPPTRLAAVKEVAGLDPAGLAEQLTLAERTILDPGSSPSEVAAAARTEQIIYFRLDTDQALAEQALPLVEASVRPAVQHYVDAGRAIASLVDPQAHYPSSWRIVAPPPPGTLRAYFEEAEAATGIPWPYFAAIAAVETRMGRIVGDSTAGAQGPMQFLPSTWSAYGGGGDIHDFRDSVLAAGRLLAANGAPGDMPAALFSYNHSESYVRSIERHVARILENDRYYLSLYHWQVLYKHVNGMTVLPEGWPEVPEQIVAPLAQTAPPTAAASTGLQTVPVTDANVAQFADLLSEAGFTTTDDSEAACTLIRVYAVDFAARSADVEVSHIVPGDRGYDCGGDTVTALYRIRGGQQDGEPITVCGDCGFDDGSLEAYRAATEAYNGRTVPQLFPWVRDGAWSIWRFEMIQLR